MAHSSNYEVRVAGVVGPAAREAFGQMQVRTELTATVLSGCLDQAGLHGLIERIEALGLELIDIKRRSPGDDSRTFPGAE